MKDDTVSRATVLKAIDDYERLSAVSQTVRNMTSLREIVQGLPSAQPEKRTEEHTETHACDCISRQAAIDTARDWYEGLICGSVKGLEKRLRALPSVQPQSEIVRCKDCKRWLHEHQCIELSEFGTIETLPNEFCSRAERRTDE